MATGSFDLDKQLRIMERNRRISKRLAAEKEEARRCRRRSLTMLFLASLLILYCCSRGVAAELPSTKELLSQYSCDWIREQRKTHTDEELERKAVELKLPRVIVRMARRCAK